MGLQITVSTTTSDSIWRVTLSWRSIWQLSFCRHAARWGRVFLLRAAIASSAWMPDSCSVAHNRWPPLMQIIYWDRGIHYPGTLCCLVLWAVSQFTRRFESYSTTTHQQPPHPHSADNTNHINASSLPRDFRFPDSTVSASALLVEDIGQDAQQLLDDRKASDLQLELGVHERTTDDAGMKLREIYNNNRSRVGEVERSAKDCINSGISSGGSSNSSSSSKHQKSSSLPSVAGDQRRISPAPLTVLQGQHSTGIFLFDFD